MSGQLREPRSFLYDDYMDAELEDRRHNDYGRSADFGISGGSALGSLRARDLDVGLDDYANIRRPTDGILRRGGGGGNHADEFLANSNIQARRFADAMGIPSSTRQQRVYDDLEYSPVQRGGRLQRVVYREVQPRARQVVRRVVAGGRADYLNPRDEVVEIVEHVQQPRRRVQVVRKVPIHQRVVKKVIVKKTVRPGSKRPNISNSSDLDRVPRVMKSRNVGSFQKRVGGRKNVPKDNKPKMSASDLDRELDEYMRASKHPRVAV